MKKLVLLVMALTLALCCFGLSFAEEYKETFYTAYGGDLDTADPYGSASGQSQFFTNLTFDTLTYVNADTGEICPELAVAWEDISEAGDGGDWKVELAQGVKFHDGTDLTAEDVKFTWEYAAVGAGNVVKGLTAANYVSEIEIVDDYTLIFHLVSSMPDFPSYMETKIYSKDAFDTKEAADAAVIGSGPYYYDSELVLSGQQYGVTRFEEYWQGTENHPSKHIVFKYIADENTRVAALAAGEIDFLFNVQPSSFETVSNLENVNIYTRTGASSYYLGFNYARDFNQDVEVRKAFAQAINKDDIIAVAFEDGIGGTANYNFVVPTGLGYTEVEPIEYNLEAAQKTIKDKGLEGKTLTIAFYSSCRPIAEVLQAHFAMLGVNLELKQVDSANWTSFKSAKAEYDFFLDYCAYQGALLYNFNRFFNTTGSSNLFGFSDPVYDEMEQEVLNAGSWDNMLVKFYDLEQWVADNIPVFPLAYSNQLTAGSDKVGGVVLAPSNNYLDLSTFYAVK